VEGVMEKMQEILKKTKAICLKVEKYDIEKLDRVF
jgi:hypothetical protein